MKSNICMCSYNIFFNSLDTNECTMMSHNCRSDFLEMCVNIPGSFRCDCQEGYTRTSNDVTCVGKFLLTGDHSLGLGLGSVYTTKPL